MNKNIEVISISSSLISYLKDQIKNLDDSFIEKKNLEKGLDNLLNGQSEILLENNDGSIDKKQDEIKCKDLSVFPFQRKVVRDGEEIILTPKEFDILYFLLINKGQVFTKEQIYQAVWEDSYLLDDSNIMSFIRKLRKKIEPNPDSPIYIITIWGIGYKFNDQL